MIKRKQLREAHLLLLAALCLASCEKLDQIAGNATTSVDTEYFEMDFTVESRDKTGFQIFREETYSYDINSLLKQAGVEPEQIEEVILREATVSMEENASYKDFDILDFIHLTVYTDLLGEQTMAWSDPVPVDQSLLSLDLSEENLLPYFKEGEFMITAQGFLKQRVYENVNLHAKVKFRVKSKL